MGYSFLCFFFNDTATTEFYTYCHTLSLHDALPICDRPRPRRYLGEARRHAVLKHCQRDRHRPLFFDERTKQFLVRPRELRPSGRKRDRLRGNLRGFGIERIDGAVAVDEELRGRRHIAARYHSHRSEEHTSELQSLMRISYAVFCLKKKT